ncbi:MAG: T9SS type A sorting domain-containing protein [Bacteroidales bacterium]|nr:T9SS type A sorting domain-containing protein [Bacteroidales bacterium]
MKKLSLLLLSMISTFFLISQTPGTLDLSFGNNGIILTDVGGVDNGCRASAIQADGKIVLGGFAYDGSNNNFSFIRYLPDGTLDNTFGSGGIMTVSFSGSGDELRDIAIQADGKIVAVGYTDSGGSGSKMVLMRLNTDGSLDNTFSIDGTVIIEFGSGTDSYGMSLDLQDDGKIVAAGYLFDVADDIQSALCRLNPDGSLDNSFGTNGIIIHDILSKDNFINNVVLQGEKIIIGGLSYIDGDEVFVTLSRFHSDGLLDMSFGVNGNVEIMMPIDTWILSPVGDMCLDNEGRIIYACYVTGIAGDHMAVLRFLESNGYPDNSFGDYGMTVTPIEGNTVAHAVTTQYDNKVIAGGYQWIEDHADFAMVRYMEDGTPDITFGTEGTGVVITNASGGGTYPDNRIYSLNMQADGKIIAAGPGHSLTGGVDFALARYHSGLNVSIETQEFSDINICINPNPVTDKAIISFNLKEPGIVKAEVLNTSGIIVAKITNEFYPAGEHQLHWDGNGLTAGVYIIKMAAGDMIYTKKVVKAR